VTVDGAGTPCEDEVHGRGDTAVGRRGLGGGTNTNGNTGGSGREQSSEQSGRRGLGGGTNANDNTGGSGSGSATGTVRNPKP
jgi:hypothetical protein